MDPIRQTSFGYRLRQYREAAAITQSELAERSGLSLRGVSDIERGVRSKPRWETIRMLADGLSLNETDFAALLKARSVHHRADGPGVNKGIGELPVYLTSFIGREKECAEICSALTRSGVRLLTVKGPGGVGKTRVVVEAARKLISHYDGRIAFADLTPVRDPQLMISVIAECLGIAEKLEAVLLESIQTAVHGKPTLLILDNFEQLTAASPQIVELLSACPELDVIVTSRVLLRVAAESVIAIPPMDSPVSLTVNSVRESPSVKMFVDRATAVDSTFELTDENAEMVSEIVNRLQGLPLSIELAAARIRMMSLRELCERLESQLLVLSSGALDIPARHQNIRSTIAWSYNLLPPQVQQTFCVMSIFPDGCTLETLISILAKTETAATTEVLDSVEILIDSSVVQKRVEKDDHVRFIMLNTIREFGLEQLDTSGTTESIRMTAHDQWCLPLMIATDFMITRPDVAWCLDQIGAEYQNLREHVAWLIEHEHVAEALEVSGYLAYFRGIRGYFEEGRKELEFLLAHPENQTLTVPRMRAVIGLGKLCNYMSDPQSGHRWLEEGTQLAADLNQLKFLEIATNASGTSQYMLGNLEEAEALYRQALKIATEADHRFQIAVGKHCLAMLAERRGETELAEKLMLESYQLCVGEDFVWSVASGKLIVSAIHFKNGDLDAAEALLLEAQELFYQLQDLRDLPSTYLKLAEIEQRRENTTGARHYILRAIEIAQSIGSPMDVALGRLALAQVARQQRETEIANSNAIAALEWFARCGYQQESAACLLVMAEIAAGENRLERAAFVLGVVSTMLPSSGSGSLLNGDALASLENEVRTSIPDSVWQVHYARGQGVTILTALAELHAW